MTDIGTPITTGQATWAILTEINSPVVGDLTKYSSPSYAFDYCFKDEVYACLSSGEQRLVKMAFSIWTGNEDFGPGVCALGGLDRTLRRKVIMILAYLYLGRDYAFDDKIEFAPSEERRTPRQ